MEPKFIQLRVYAEYSETHKVFVAYCLETGGVVTADDEDTIKDMMKELLEDELTYALHHKNLTNLFSSPAPLDIWKKWYETAKKMKPASIPLEIDTSEAFPGQLEVPSEAQMATAS